LPSPGSSDFDQLCNVEKPKVVAIDLTPPKKCSICFKQLSTIYLEVMN
jgi:hypothetical protein